MALRDYITTTQFNTPQTGGMTGVSLTWNVNEGKEFPAWESSNLHYYSNFDGSLNCTYSNIIKNSGDSFYPLILFYYNSSDVALANPNIYPFVYRIGTNTDYNYSFTINNGISWGWAHREGNYTTQDGNDLLYPPLIITNMASTSAVIVRNNTANKMVTFDTNIPILIMDLQLSGNIWNRLYNVINDYFSSGNVTALLSIINEDTYKDNVVLVNYDTSIKTEPEGNTFTIYNTGQRGTWKVGDIVEDVSSPFYRWARVKLATTSGVDGRLAFYKAGLEDGIIKLKPVSVASVVYCEYSTDGGANWQESDTFPFQYIYGERTNELGTFLYATRSGLGGASGVPVFEDETTATKWVNHDNDVDITDAVNYEDIATRYKYTNKTGDNETSTTMGTASGFRSHFTQKYLLDRGEVSTIANAMFDTTTTIFDDIVQGLKCFGERVIDSICSLTYYPIDLTTVFTQLQNQSYIFFGGYQFQPENFSVNKLVGYSGYIDLGSFTIEPTFPNIEDARNYAPFCRVSIYLPYCGMFELDYNKYVNKTIRVRYYIDVNTGGCLVCLFDSATDGRLLDYMNGQIGSQIPITITDYAGYASAELRNISNLAGVGGNVLTTGLAGAQGDIMGVGVGAVSSLTGFGKAMYDLSTTSISQFNSTKGSSGALGNQYLPQYVYLIFEYVRTEETANLLQLEGKPSNKSGTVGSFSGYLEVDSVQLQCSGATETEKAEIINILHNGIII